MVDKGKLLHKNIIMDQLNRWVVLAALVLVILVFSLLNEHFFSIRTFYSVGMTLSVIGVICIGQTLCILTGGFDLSVGEVAAFTAILAAYLSEKMGMKYISVFMIAMLFGLIAGLLNGFLISKLKVNAFITTLAFMSIYKGCVYILSEGYSIMVRDPAFSFLGTTKIFTVPLPIIILLLLYILFFIIMKYTVFGRYVYCLGGNAEAARIAGVNTDRIRILVYTLCSVLAAFAGLMLASRLGAAQATAGGSYALDSVAAVVLGGSALSGGKGNMLGSFLGIAILGALQTGLIMIQMPVYYQFVATGLVLIIAVLLQTFEERSKTAA
jgi:ribose transport system permease protein